MVLTQLAAGVGQSIITPPAGAPLLGPLQPSTGVHDDLFARTLVLTDGSLKTAIIGLDLVGLDTELAADIRAAIKAETGIATVFLNCSHTHSAPFTIPWSVLGADWIRTEGRPWRTQLVQRVAATVSQACADVAPATLRAGRAPVRIGHNRRLSTPDGVTMKPNPDGPYVPWVDVLCVEGSRGETRALLFSHAAHPVIVHASSTLVSADYPGCAAAKIRERDSHRPLAIFLQGCGGNVNAEPLRGGFEAAEQAGAALAEAVIRAAADSHALSCQRLRAASHQITLPFRNAPSVRECADSLREAEERLQQTQTTADRPDWSLQDNVLCLRDLLAKAKGKLHQALPFEAQGLALGDQWCLTAMPHEVFAEYQLWVCQTSPFHHNMVLGYTPVCESYIPSDRDFELGGYEAAAFPAIAASLRYRHRLTLQPGIEGLIQEGLVRLWAALRPSFGERRRNHDVQTVR